MSDSAKKQAGYKTLRKRLKARERSIQRLRNKIAWLELQLTLHFVEDRRAEDSERGDEVSGEDDCIKCEQLRSMLDASIQLPQIPELRMQLEDHAPDVFSESHAVATDPQLMTSDDRQDVMVTIDPSRHSLSFDQQGDTTKIPPEQHGFFSGQTSENICCIFIVAVAILLVNWI